MINRVAFWADQIYPLWHHSSISSWRADA